MTRTSFLSFGFISLATSAMAAKPGLPQMDPTWFANQLAWLAICFVVLYMLVAHVIVPSVSTVLATRKDTIAEAIAKAEAYKKDAAEAKVSSQSRAHEVHEQVTAMINEAKTKAGETSAKALAKLNHDLDAKLNHALLEVNRALAAAQPAMQQATNEVARTIAETLLGQSVDAAAITAARKAA